MHAEKSGRSGNLPSRVLFVRTDGVGDLLLVTPALKALKEKYPGVTVDFLCSGYAAPILLGDPEIDRILHMERSSGVAGFFRLVRSLRSGGYECAFLFFVTPKAAVALFLAGIPLRVGPFSKVFSLFLNERVVQSRSLALRHESAYNIELVKKIFPDTDAAVRPPSLFISDSERALGLSVLTGAGFEPGAILIGINPGGRGSNLLFPQAKFMELADWLLGTQLNPFILFTGFPEETEPYRKKYSGNSRVIIPSADGLRRLASMISHCSLFVANSSGPLHIASALGIKSLSFFSPIRVTKPVRWGPIYRNPAMFRVLMPPKPAECEKCSGSACREYNCLGLIEMNIVKNAVKELLSGITLGK